MKKKYWHLIIGSAISLGVLLLLFRKIPFESVLGHIRGLNPYILVAAFFLYFLEFFVPAVRFALIGRQNLVKISLSSSYASSFIGALGNYILPARAGEILKALYLERANAQEGFGKTKVFGMLFWERALDFIVIFFLLVAMLSYYGILGETSTSVIPLVIVSSGILLSLIFLMIGKRIFMPLVRILFKGKLKIKIEQYSTYVFDLFHQYRKPVFIINQVLITAVYWLVVMLGYYFIFLSAGISLSFMESLLFLSIGTMGVAIPAGPGSVGIIQGAFVLAGSISGVDADLSLALGIVYQGVQALFCAVFGGVFSLHNYNKWGRPS